MKLSKRVRPDSSKRSVAKHKARQSRNKRALFCIHLSLFLGWRKGFLLTKRRLPLRRAMHSPCACTLFESCQRQTRPRLLAAASAAMQKPPPTPLHVRGCCALRRFIWRYRVARFKFTAELNLVPSSGRSRRLKFESKMIRRSIVR